MRGAIYEYEFKFAKGTVYIMPDLKGRWNVVFDGEGLGSYHSPEAAADDVAGGHTFAPAADWDFDQFDIPADISEWSSRPVAEWKGMRPS